MADGLVVVTDASEDTPAVGQLFKGINFFLSLRLPTRSKFVADVEANGGRVVKLEKHANFVIADHMRKPTPAGSFSYTLIEQAVRDGIIPNPADHALGPTADSPRAMGSREPGKRTRTAFTAEDDLALWQWVEQEKAQGQLVKGNDIYKRLEAVNSRHTWQAWRDHYVKKLMDNPPYGAMADDASPMDSGEEQPLVALHTPSGSNKRRSKQPMEVDADQEDFDLLWEQAKDIENMDEDMYEEAWDLWAQVNAKHAAEDWRRIWERDVRPAYRKQRAKVKTKRRHASISDHDGANSTSRKSRKKGKSHAVTPVEIDANCAGEVTDGLNDQAAVTGDLQDPDDDLAALETWQGSSKRDSDTQYHVEGSDAQTLEVNRAVGEQIQTEIARATPGENAQNSDKVLTSDANRAADLQMQKEAIGAEQKQRTLTPMVAEQSFASQEPETTFNGVANHNPSHSHDAIHENGSEVQHGELHAWYAERVEELSANTTKPGMNGHALTEANVVRQQAEHTDPLTRGVDLPEDDHNKDQSEYVEFLQNVTGRLQGKGPDSDHDLPPVLLPARALAVAKDFGAASNIRVSSQQEVDGAMKDAVGWPSSPQQNEDKSQSQEEQFETQLPHTRRNLPKDHARNLIPDFELSSQTMMSQTNNEGFLSQGEYDAADASTIQEDRLAQPDIFEGLADINDRHINLSMPEPEGDFTFTSSPERGQVAASSSFTDSQGSGNLAERERSARKAGPLRNEVVNISSDDSSSSLPNSQPDAPSTVQAKGKHVIETQDILSAETQRPDFFMPLPDDEQGQEEESEFIPQAPGRRANNTQDVTAEQMQAPDLSIPLPPEWETCVEGRQDMPGKAPARQSNEQQGTVDSQTMDVERELESWLDTQHVRGFSEASAIAAMQCSSMRPDLAELVLLAEKGGLGVPSDIPGIWSAREDATLESGDSGALRRLEAKHGWGECKARLRFLEEWREA